MQNLRFWILLLACSAFGAGLGVGWFAASRVHARETLAADAGPFAGFEAQFARTFKISKERERLLGELLTCYKREIDEKEQDQLEKGRTELDRELEKLSLTYRERIRNSVLLPEQRTEYDRLAAGMDWKANN